MQALFTWADGHREGHDVDSARQHQELMHIPPISVEDLTPCAASDLPDCPRFLFELTAVDRGIPLYRQVGEAARPSGTCRAHR